MSLYTEKLSIMVSTILFSSAAVLISGCSDEKDKPGYEGNVTKSTPHNTMDVKQPLAGNAPQLSLQSEPVPQVQKSVEDSTLSAKSEVVDGKKAFTVCVGCHGAHAEGGVGPRLNNQTADVIVSKLKRYKAGEQIGPMSVMMRPMAEELNEAEMKAIADYVVTLQ